MKEGLKIIISRTDNIGDVVLTLPLAGIIKSKFPDAHITFIGKSYTKPVIDICTHVDQFVERDEIIKNPGLLKELKADAILFIFPDKQIAKAAYQAAIPLRVGTSHRFFHWLYCNKRINFSRKNSDLHEAELNQKLLVPLGITEIQHQSRVDKYYGVKINDTPLPFSIGNADKTKIIFHPKSKGSAREWPLENFYALAKLLPEKQYTIIITGTETEGNLVKNQKPEILALPHVLDLTGKCTLEELILLINKSQGIIACSTGPIHIGAALGKNVCAIFPPMRPIHPGRWAPLGKNVSILVRNADCNLCRASVSCECISSISPTQVLSIIKKWSNETV